MSPARRAARGSADAGALAAHEAGHLLVGRSLPLLQHARKLAWAVALVRAALGHRSISSTMVYAQTPVGALRSALR